MIHEKSAGAIIFRRETPPKNSGASQKIKYLLLHYESGHWDFPRGHIERGETEKETARREIEEETGIKKINFLPGFRLTHSWFYRKRFDKKTILSHKTAILFLAETKTHQVKISPEHIGYKWLEFKKAKETLTFANSKKLLEKADKYLTSSKFCV